MKINYDYKDNKIVEEFKKGFSEEILKPVVIEACNIGKFVLNREFSCFESEIECLGYKFDMILKTDEEGDTAGKALEVLKKLYPDLEAWDKRFREYAAEELTDLANDWLEEEDDEELSDEINEITEEDFARRIRISEFIISPDGELRLYYDDGNMFWGHAVQVIANINGEISEADMV